MQILYLDSDPDRSAKWRERLLSADFAVTTAGSVADAIDADPNLHCPVAICDYRSQSCRWADAAPDAIQQVHVRCHHVIGVIRRDDYAHLADVYNIGFDDYLFEDCCDEELVAKLRKAEHLEQLNQRLAQAQKLESIGELAAGIAHEINTPIQYVGDNTRFVQGACDDLNEVLQCCQKLVACTNSDIGETKETLRSLMDDADVEYLLEEIPSAIRQTLEGVDRVANIVRAMKEFAHPGVSEMTLFDLSTSIENTVMVARNEWKYVAEVKTDFDSELPPVPCLPGELNQVLLNMIVNASHAIADSLGESPEEKGTITITTKLAPPHAEIRVADSGVGIAQENIERIFAPFFTTKAAGKGTGQGLAIAHTVVVEKHGGTIHVESELGVGTTFVIRIPLEMRSQDEPLDADLQETMAVS